MEVQRDTKTKKVTQIDNNMVYYIQDNEDMERNYNVVFQKNKFENNIIPDFEKITNFQQMPISDNMPSIGWKRL